MLNRVTGPAVEPISLSEARTHLRVDAGYVSEDGLIAILITMAREAAESATQRTLITTAYRLTLVDFPRVIELERGPVQAVDAITYQTGAGWVTLASTEYTVDLTGGHARIAPAYGKSWPSVLGDPLANVRIDYVAGFGDAGSDVPATIRQWMLLAIGSAWVNRESIAAKGADMGKMPFVDGLLDSARVPLA